MSELPNGYQLFWKRVARHVSLSDAAKQIGVRASALSTFEKNGEHILTPENILALDAYLESVPLPEPDVPEILDEPE
jgi:hypothetical protein